ncbi:MAG: hydrogenase expression/formation protein HypE [Lachnospiraceae bacterium]|jgi:hydrogenase expression/formation protein HypE|nr:hydrogenase expression/formation protein HypE [Lachnospiraceae bacterium]
MTMTETITMAHGSGGQATGELIAGIFAEEFDNEILNQMEDSAVVPGSSRIALTTDSFVVTPLEYRGGNIGRLSVCGTVNDLLMRGATPKYLTAGFILQEGLSTELLRRVVHAMAETAREAGVQIVAGDTKVIDAEQSRGGMMINTAGVGFVPEGLEIGASGARDGDAILVSGNMGDHHAAILSERMQIDTDIQSDNAPLGEMVQALIAAGVKVHVLRDITRGGLGTVLKELAEACGLVFTLESDAVPVSPRVRDFCGLLGLDPMYMGNEGKLTAIVDGADAEKALAVIRASRYGADAAIIGRVTTAEKSEGGRPGDLLMRTPVGGMRRMDVLQGEGLPRIC